MPKASHGGSLPVGLRRTAWALVVLSILCRVIHLQSPLLEIHSFRQTHNGMVIYWMAKNGISFLDYQAPLFGPPWQLDVDFPFFQAAASVLVRYGGLNVDLAGRLTGLLFFYLSAVMVYQLGRRLFPFSEVPLIALLFYLYSPLSVLWSRACMIDFAAIFFAMVWLYCGLEFLRNERRFGLLLVGTAAGALATAIKSIVMPVFGVLLAVWLWRRCRAEWRLAGLSGRPYSWLMKRRLAFAAGMLTLLTVPVLAGWFWMQHANAVNLASPYTAFHASSNMREWIFGTWSQRLDPMNWLILAGRMVAYAFPYALILFPIIGIRAAWKMSQRHRRFATAAVLGPAVTIFTFFNLFVVHDYYLVAAMPLFSFLAAMGAWHLWQTGVIRLRIGLLPAGLLLGSFLLGSGHYLYWTVRFDYDYELCRVGRLVREVTPEDEYVIVTDFYWHTSILYYSERRGFMVVADHDVEPPWDQFHRLPYRTIVSKQDQPDLLLHWSRHRLVGRVGDFRVFRVSGPQAVSGD